MNSSVLSVKKVIPQKILRNVMKKININNIKALIVKTETRDTSVLHVKRFIEVP